MTSLRFKINESRKEEKFRFYRIHLLFDPNLWQFSPKQDLNPESQVQTSSKECSVPLCPEFRFRIKQLYLGPGASLASKEWEGPGFESHSWKSKIKDAENRQTKIQKNYNWRILIHLNKFINLYKLISIETCLCDWFCWFRLWDCSVGYAIPKCLSRYYFRISFNFN